MKTNNLKTTTHQTFFPPIYPVAFNEPKLINVGGAGDCGFRSVAAGIIDNILRNTTNEILLKQLLIEHLRYFNKPQTVHQTPHHIFTNIIKNDGISKLITDLAYTLRQIAVSEMCAQPIYYLSAFIKKNEHTSPEHMRKKDTWIDETAIAALANVLNLPITVNIMTNKKELPFALRYLPRKEGIINNLKNNNDITIQLKNKHYIPLIYKVDEFRNIKNVPAASPDNKALPNDPNFATLIAKIHHEEQKTLHKFFSITTRLSTALANKEISKELLLDIYIHSMDHSDYLQGSIKYLGLEHGNQKFFEDLIATKQPVATTNDNNQAGYDDFITEELIHAIARAVSINQLNEEFLNSKLKQKLLYSAPSTKL